VRKSGGVWIWLLVPAVTLVLGSCKPDTKVEAPEVRPVRTMTASKGEAGETVVLTGHIRAEDEPALAFRIGGRMIERPVNVGDRVEAGQVLAKLDPGERAQCVALGRSRSRSRAGTIDLRARRF
jgi:multidrug efflux pump subunit AcrA (membrane-fusion protein)